MYTKNIDNTLKNRTGLTEEYRKNLADLEASAERGQKEINAAIEANNFRLAVQKENELAAINATVVTARRVAELAEIRIPLKGEMILNEWIGGPKAEYLRRIEKGHATAGKAFKAFIEAVRAAQDIEQEMSLDGAKYVALINAEDPKYNQNNGYLISRNCGASEAFAMYGDYGLIIGQLAHSGVVRHRPV